MGGGIFPPVLPKILGLTLPFLILSTFQTFQSSSLISFYSLLTFQPSNHILFPTLATIEPSNPIPSKNPTFQSYSFKKCNILILFLPRIQPSNPIPSKNPTFQSYSFQESNLPSSNLQPSLFTKS